MEKIGLEETNIYEYRQTEKQKIFHVNHLRALVEIKNEGLLNIQTQYDYIIAALKILDFFWKCYIYEK